MVALNLYELLRIALYWEGGMDGWKWNGGAGRVCLNLEPANIPSSSKFYAWPYRFFVQNNRCHSEVDMQDDVHF